MSEVRILAERARAAARLLAKTPTAAKNAALLKIAAALRANVQAIGDANQLDVEQARLAGRPAAFLDRLTLSSKVVAATAAGVESVALLDDPVGQRSPMRRLESGLWVAKQRLPLGVIAMIYESRPNVTVDAAALCLKTGNAVLLRGGKEAAHSNRLLGSILHDALKDAELPVDAVQIVPAEDRQSVLELLSLSEWIDLAIPRGGPELVRFVAEHARVPVVKHYQGVCHLYLDKGCNGYHALRLALNGKTQRPGTCNALECLLVHADEAETLLPAIASALLGAGVEIRGCPRTCALVPQASPASADDFGREFLDAIIAVRVVDDFDAALAHVERYGSNHTEVICTENLTNAERWLEEVDASCVMINASPRLNDGSQLGLGTEIGISTSKLHAYGPMGLESLTAEKFVVIGQGQVRG